MLSAGQHGVIPEVNHAARHERPHPTRADSLERGAAVPSSSDPGLPDSIGAKVDDILLLSKQLRRENDELIASVASKDAVITNGTDALLAERQRADEQALRLKAMEGLLSEAELAAEAAGHRADSCEKRSKTAEDRAEALQRDAAVWPEERQVEAAKRESDDSIARREAERVSAGLQERVREMASELGRLRGRSESHDNVSHDLERAASEADRAKVELRSLQTQYDEQAAARQESDSRLEAAQDANAADAVRFRSEREQLSATFAALQADSAKLTAELENAAESSAASRQDLQQEMHETVSRLQAALPEREQAVAAATTDAHGKTATIATYAEHLSRAEGDLQDASRQLEQQSADVSSAADLEVSVARLTRERDDVKQSLLSAQALCQSIRDQASRGALAAADAVKQLQSRIAALEETAARDSQNHAATATRDAQRLRELLAARESAVNTAELAVVAERGTAERLRAEPETARASLATVTAHHASESRRADEERQRLSESLNAALDDTRKLTEERTVLGARAKAAEQAAKSARSQLAEMEAQKQQTEATWNEQTAGLRSLASKAEEKCAHLQRQLDGAVAKQAALSRELKLAQAAPALARDAVLAATAHGKDLGSGRWRQRSIVQPIDFTVPVATDLQFSVSLPDKGRLFYWGYDIVAASQKVPSILQCVATEAAIQLGLFPATPSGSETLRRWQNMMAMMDANYRTGPYHTAVHAADVLQSLCALLLAAPELLRRMTRVEKLAAIFAAVAHDVRHPARSDTFLKNTFDPVYILYNGKTALEQMHTSTAFALLSVPDADFTLDLSDAEALEVHGAVSMLIGHTAMSGHARAVEGWSETVYGGEGFDCSSADGRLELLALLLHAADVGAQAKGVEVARKWLTVVEEMHDQGDDERARGLCVSPGCARPARDGDVTLAQGQVYFMTAVVAPLFQLVEAVFPAITAPMKSLRDVHAFYKAMNPSVCPLPDAPSRSLRSDATAGKAASAPPPGPADSDSGGESEADHEARAAYAKLKAFAAELDRREASLKHVETKIAHDISALSATRDDRRGAAGSFTPADRPSSAGLEQKLLRATAKVVAKEQQLRERAGELQSQACELDERERLCAVLSDQLASIADRVNHQRRKLAHRVALLAEGAPAAGALVATGVQTTSRKRVVPLALDSKDATVQRLSLAIEDLRAAVVHAREF